MCDLILVLDDGVELFTKEQMDRNLRFFPLNIIEKMETVITAERYKAGNEWGRKSIVRVYQNGKYEVESNVKVPLLTKI